MTTASTNNAASAEIAKLVAGWSEAVRAKDVDRVMSHYTPDVLVFETMPPLRYVGAEAYRPIWQEWFSGVEGKLEYEIRELTITANDDVGYSYSLNCVRTETATERSETWLRTTTCYRKQGGKWLITHEHWSMPFDVQTGQALWDLKP